jgi:CubicO group peptidase (beta-lactamase class C family)
MLPWPTRCAALITLALLAAACGTDGRGPPEPLPPPADIDALARPLVDDGWTVGMVIGIMRPDGSTEVYAYGAVETGGAPPTASTLFEIGSISKTFTSLALADMVAEGVVTLDQPVQELLPAAEVAVPAGTVPISLAHLSTHTSGLPRMPDNFAPADPTNPYIDYGADDLYAFLGGHTLTAEPGTRYEYSNVAVGLLGHALGLADGASWERVVASRIAEPLGLADTVMTLSGDHATRFATGHDGDLNAVAAWDFDVLAGAGALRSTADDLLVYLAAQAGRTSTDLSAAIASTHEPRFSLSAELEIGLAWLIEDGRYIWHNGGTGGFGSFAGIDVETQSGVVVLCNTSGGQNAETLLGLELLKLVAGEPHTALALPPTLEVSAAEFERYAGHFVAGEDAFDVVLREGALYFEVPGELSVRMYASGPDGFYLRAVSGVWMYYTCDAAGCNTITIEYPEGTFMATRSP